MAESGEGRARATAWALGLLVVLIWGGSFVATRVAVREIPPLTLALLRFAIGMAVLWPAIRPALRRTPIDAAGWRLGFFVGLTGVTLAFVFENVGLSLTTAANGSLIVATTPLATALTEAAMARRWPPWPTLVGLVVSLAGVALIVGRPAVVGGSRLGDALMACTVLAWVAYSLLARRLIERYPLMVVTYLAFVWGIVSLVPLAAAELAVCGLPDVPSPAAIGALLFLGVMCSALGYLWWGRALRDLGVTATNSLIYGIPLVAVATEALVLGEAVTVTVAVGAALVLTGLWVANASGIGRRAAP